MTTAAWLRISMSTFASTRSQGQDSLLLPACLKVYLTQFSFKLAAVETAMYRMGIGCIALSMNASSAISMLANAILIDLACRNSQPGLVHSAALYSFEGA